MIQSRFHNQVISKHPQRPENGGSGPAPTVRMAPVVVRAPKRSPVDSAIGALMDDTRAGDRNGAFDRFMEFSRENALFRGRTRGKKTK